MCRKRIGVEIRILNNLIRRSVENAPNKKMIDEVTGTNGWIIGYLSDHKDQDVFQRDFEEEFGMTRSTASKVVNLMEKKGLVTRCSVPGDARLKKLEMTPRAEEINNLMLEDFRGIESTLLDGFSDEELAIFYDILHRMQNNLKNAQLQHKEL